MVGFYNNNMNHEFAIKMYVKVVNTSGGSGGGWQHLTEDEKRLPETASVPERSYLDYVPRWYKWQK